MITKEQLIEALWAGFTDNAASYSDYVARLSIRERAQFTLDGTFDMNVVADHILKAVASTP